ncbi:Bug family tripartite tricarboxylate transporter substrate binding protein [Azohydromonas caseinilytica]|uniref:Tripartite tricarboxylate transporter substrate binding protein n=1 Tax=Azohydromonas caseinilytica TaxID=2728836 RepID=A0A848FDS3_9BURK|nr:tripartite tricarboxylate transporter substrate binding protein [Azohydromonas caseinilytica]NML17538.1 tripartite tricarboxylate transporter substrate binding protein [Azohydromonas caseinilytica]
MTALPRRRLLQAASASLLTPLFPLAAHAEEAAWPSKPIRWVVAYPAGGGSDFLARQLAPQIGRQLGQTIYIENRPGAAGIIGTDNAAKAAPDGYTLLTGDNGAMVFHQAMYKRLPYDPRDFAPVGFMARFPLIVVVNPNAGFSDGRQWLQALKANPGRYSYASPGIGSPHHLAMELLKERTGSFVVHVPYRGTAFASQDVIAGQVPMTVLDTAAGLPLIRSGKLKALAVMSAHRIPTLPQVPTLQELGLRDFEATAWQALFVPRGTPGPIVQRLSVEMRKAILAPEVKARLEDFGLEVLPGDGPALAAFLQKETAFWHALIKARRLAAE